MKNKNLYLMLGMALATFVGVVGSFTSAVSFNITFGTNGRPARIEYVERNITPIHFKDNGNDFAGFIYFSNVSTGDEEDLNEKYSVVLGGDKYECFQKVKGYYYNAERGERLWPLDESYNIPGLEISGGLYTRCRKSGYKEEMDSCAGFGSEDKIEECEEMVRNKYADTHGYYGQIIHKYNGVTGWVLLAGTNYDWTGSADNIWAYFTGEFAASLIRYDNKYPVGIIYDTNGGAGLLGCSVLGNYHVWDVVNKFKNSNNDWTKLFSLSGDGVAYNIDDVLDCSDQGSAMNSLIKVIVDGLVGINRDTQNIGIIGNQSNEKMQYFSSVNINNTQLINYARQKAEILCRGKWTDSVKNDGRVIQCLSGIINPDPVKANTGWTYIVKNHDVQVMGMDNFDGAGNYDVFIDSGNLLIEPTDDSALKVFKRNGFISSTSTGKFNQDVFEIWDRTGSNYAKYTGEDISVGKFIKGNFIINGNIKAISGDTTDGVLKDRYFVYGKMTTNDTVKELENVFKRGCRADGSSNMIDTNGYPCPLSFSGWNNPYEGASLVIIDQNYPSPLYD